MLQILSRIRDSHFEINKRNQIGLVSDVRSLSAQCTGSLEGRAESEGRSAGNQLGGRPAEIDLRSLTR
jgi:hypothetical protein